MRAELLAMLGLLVATTAGAEPWPSCSSSDTVTCAPVHLNITVAGGNATLSVDAECRAEWTHLWRVDDARAEIRQWLDGAWARGRGSVCIPFTEEVDEIRVSPLDGHCSFDGIETGAPGTGGVLEKRRTRVLTIGGCHARVESLRFGGVALILADGYGFGDAYAAGHFYGVYDGFGARVVAGTEASVFRLSDFNTHRYRVEFFAAGSPAGGFVPRGDDR